MSIYYVGSNLRLETDPLADGATEVIATNTDIGYFNIKDIADPNIRANVSWNGNTLTANTTWIQGANVSDQDVSNKMCIYVSGNDLILKNNLGSVKTFVIIKEI